jgi:hypothetical protein
MNSHFSKLSFAEFSILDSSVRGSGTKKYIGNNNSSRSCSLFREVSRNQPSFLGKKQRSDAGFLTSGEVVPLKGGPIIDDCVTVADAEKTKMIGC